MAIQVVYEVVGANGQKIRDHRVFDFDSADLARRRLEEELHTVVHIVSSQRI